jgi:hypothetical protein
MRLHMSYIVVFRIRISIRISKKKYVSVFEKIFSQFNLEALWVLREFSMPFNSLFITI